MVNSDQAVCVSLSQNTHPVNDTLFSAMDFRQIIQCNLSDDIRTTGSSAIHQKAIDFLLYIRIGLT